jgi:multiple sugar transport system permease protein
VVILAIMLFPIYWMLNTSFQPTGTAIGIEPFPLNPSVEAYAQAFHDQIGNLGTSLAIAVGTVILTLVVAIPAGYALAQNRARWVSVALLAMLVAQMIPGIVIANAIYGNYVSLGLLNSIPGLIIADTAGALPLAILILRAFMMGLPESIVEAARVDGAGHLRVLLSIVSPISRNAIVTAALFAFLGAWGDFLFALTLTTGSEIRPVTLGIYNYLQANTQSWAPVMATAVLASIPAAVLLTFAQKFIAAGAIGGAVK